MAQYVTGLVIQKNNIVYINTGGVSIGSTQEIPTPENGAVIDGDMWAIPVNDGVYSGFIYQPYNPANPLENVAPLFAVAVVRISSRISPDYFIVLGTAAQYITADGGSALPTAWPQVSHGVPELPACQILNGTNANGLYVGVIGIPSLVGGTDTISAYFPFGYWNGAALPAATANGYTTTSALLTFLNTATVNTGTATAPVYTGGWSIAGTWTVTTDSLTLVVTQSAGSGTDKFCGGLLAINPSL
jgi:hypothetical protein